MSVVALSFITMYRHSHTVAHPISIQVNHLSTALLTLLLTPALTRGAEAHSSLSRIVIVASSVHFWTKYGYEYAERGILETLNDKTFCTPEVMARRYVDSKRTYQLTTSTQAHHSTDNFRMFQYSTSSSLARWRITCLQCLP